MIDYSVVIEAIDTVLCGALVWAIIMCMLPRNTWTAEYDE